MSAPSSKHTPRPVSSKTTYALGAVAVVVVALIIFAFSQWNTGGSDSIRNDGYGSAHNPAVSVAMDSDGAIVLGKPDVTKTIDIYEDPLCPACGQLEKLYGQEIPQQVDEGKLSVRYRLVNFLDSKSGSKDYSTRAVAANECVAQAGDGPAYAKFHTLLFTTKQPSEGGSDHNNQDLAAIAKESGASADALKCITTGDRLDSARNHAESAMKALTSASGDRVATPSVFLDGHKIDVNKEDWVLSAAK
ncbi:thioredoxin domain-containing protein [Nocardia sp. SYP-A9097]|uniref:DsbA family protein n=1 Tax=Nocardia sp. SYP-A9097 TaxID=2663237 RepID=UPI001324E76D|nr:thioredoxin domain-containing protein [Nocardia sp. SYP-A9097]MRH88114.1 thioredoxin domain-containing protein [Nocardia sp. SYP-A9097]